MKISNRLLVCAIICSGIAPVWAQTDEHAGHAAVAPPNPVQTQTKTPQDTMPGMDHGAMDMAPVPAPSHAGHNMNQEVATPPESATTPTVDHSAHTMPTIPASSDLRDPHAYADGYEFSQFPMRHHDHSIRSSLIRADRFEMVQESENTFANYDLQALYGGNYDRVIVKAEGYIDDQKIKQSKTELLWSHTLSTFWNTELGLRHDAGEGPNRSWFAAGFQGLAPYWFELDATAYLGEQGRAAANFQAEYEILLTQKWILQPRAEFDLLTKSDPEHAQGSGLTEASLGLRLRYEFRREFAPYLGIEWAGKFGGTADFARDAGASARETRWVAGLRFWI